MKSKYSKTTRQLLDEIRQNQIDETITAVKNKAKKTGMPYSILKKLERLKSLSLQYVKSVVAKSVYVKNLKKKN